MRHSRDKTKGKQRVTRTMMSEPIIHPIKQRTVEGDHPITSLGDDSPLSTARQTQRKLIKIVHDLHPVTDTAVAHPAEFEHHGFGMVIESKDCVDRCLEAGTHFLIPAGRGLKLNFCFSEFVAEGVDFGFLANVFLVGVFEQELTGNT